jgi:hypothetical protein
LGGLAIPRWDKPFFQEDFPEGGGMLARVAEGKVIVRSAPNVDAPEVGALYLDKVVPWHREVVGVNPYRFSQRWVETPDGYIWSPYLQPVYNRPNAPAEGLQDTSLGPGMWVQVSVPWVDVILENAAPYSPSIKARVEEGLLPRLYYSQILWVDQIDVDANGDAWYRINERYSYGDVFWGRAEAFRPMTLEEVEPITPEVENKRVEVNLNRQSLSCFEDEREVYYCRVSTGMIGEDTETPPGVGYRVWRKMVSSHMSGGTTGGGWDLPGVGFTTLFIGDGIAIHSTFWHNNYGERTSRGCVNVRPDDAQWIFRWTRPVVGYDPGDVTISDFTGTNIQVLEE